MEKITCEACGSREMSQHEGYYICDYCQTKYMHKEAKKKEQPKAEDVATKTAVIKEEPVRQAVPFLKPKKNSIIKRAFGILFMILGVFFLMIAFTDLSKGRFFGFINTGVIGTLLFNTGFTYKTSKNVLLTEKLKPWQLWLGYFAFWFLFDLFFK